MTRTKQAKKVARNFTIIQNENVTNCWNLTKDFSENKKEDFSQAAYNAAFYWNLVAERAAHLGSVATRSKDPRRSVHLLAVASHAANATSVFTFIGERLLKNEENATAGFFKACSEASEASDRIDVLHNAAFNTSASADAFALMDDLKTALGYTAHMRAVLSLPDLSFGEGSVLEPILARIPVRPIEIDIKLPA